MKKTLAAFAAFAAFAALAASAATVRTATEAFVTNRITAATNALATASDAAYMPKASAYTKGETDARIVELAPPADLSPATNYTDRATNALATSSAAALTTATNALATSSAAAYMPQSNAYTKAETDARIITTNDVCAIVTNTTFGEWQFDGTSYMFEGVSPDGQDHYDLPTTLISLQWFYATNEIPESAKSILDGLCIQINDSILPVRYAVYTIHASDVGGGDYLLTNRVVGCENSFSVLSTPTKIELTSGAGDYGFYLTRKEYNTLGLARLSDIPTNHVTKAEMQEAIDGIEIPDVSGLATKGEVAAVSNEAQVVYRLFSGSNVVDEVTNYNSQVRLPSRRLYQLTESNTYHMVWNELDQHTNTLAKAKAYADDLGTNYAPKAWSRTTAMYGAEAPSNTTWISTPTTVIAAGYEYQKYATSGGAIWVLTSRGAAYDFSPNTNNTAYLNIAAQDGTPIFRIEKTDSYLLGVNASAIEVQDDVMFVDVNIAAASHPFVRVCAQLGDGWQKEEDGISASLATVNWTQTQDGYRCAIQNNTGGSSLFAYFEYLQEGSVKIVNGGLLDVTGGLIVNGTIYTRIGTATISGHTVLTLEQ